MVGCYRNAGGGDYSVVTILHISEVMIWWCVVAFSRDINLVQGLI